ncbi:MAG: hypothetical protein ACRDVG_15185 [Jatrophihabitantaceae bacterium]
MLLGAGFGRGGWLGRILLTDGDGVVGAGRDELIDDGALVDGIVGGADPPDAVHPATAHSTAAATAAPRTDRRA